MTELVHKRVRQMAMAVVLEKFEVAKFSAKSALAADPEWQLLYFLWRAWQPVLFSL